MKLARALIYLIILFLLICFIAISCLVLLIDPNEIKPTLIKEIATQTGYKAKIDGKLTWSFYPHIGVSAPRIELIAPSKAPLNFYGIVISGHLSDLWHFKDLIHGSIFIKSMQILNMNLHDVSTKIRWENKILYINDVHADLYNGSLNGKLLGRNLANTPSWDINLSGKNIDIQTLVHDLNGSETKLSVSGSADANLIATTKGIEHKTLLANLNGQLNYVVNKGILNGIDINYFLQLANALINKQPIQTLVNTSKTPFETMLGNILIREGILESKDLNLKSAGFSANASGKLSLLTQNINLQILVSPQAELFNSQWQIPIEIIGTLKQPDINLDVKAVEKKLLEKNLDKIKEKANEVIEKHLDDKAKNLINSLLGH